jgi:hypothetical protein
MVSVAARNIESVAVVAGNTYSPRPRDFESRGAGCSLLGRCVGLCAIGGSGPYLTSRGNVPYFNDSLNGAWVLTGLRCLLTSLSDRLTVPKHDLTSWISGDDMGLKLHH